MTVQEYKTHLRNKRIKGEIGYKQYFIALSKLYSHQYGKKNGEYVKQLAFESLTTPLIENANPSRLTD